MQIKGFTTLAASQAGLLAPETITRNMGGLVDSLDLQIRSVSLSHAEAASLNIAITEGKFSPDQKLKLATSISERVSTAPEHGSTNRNQTLTNVLAYFTASDWLVFEDCTLHMTHKLGRISERCRLLGVCNPSEVTTKNLAAIIASTHCPSAGPKALHGIVVDIKKGLHEHRSAVTSKLVKYPTSPMELPKHMYDAANAGEAPVIKILDSFGAVAAKIPMRMSNRAMGQPSYSPNIGNVVEQLLAHLQVVPQHRARRSPVELTQYGESIARGHSRSDLHFGSDSSPDQRQPVSRFALLDDLARQLGGGAHGAGRAQQASVPGVAPAVPSTPTPLITPPLCVSATPGGTGDDDESAIDAAADDAVRRLETLAAKAADTAPKGSKKPKGVMKRPAAAPTGGTVAAKRPAAATPEAMLGCAKCRGSPGGCAQCRDHGFAGRRFTRE